MLLSYHIEVEGNWPIKLSTQGLSSLLCVHFLFSCIEFDHCMLRRSLPTYAGGFLSMSGVHSHVRQVFHCPVQKIKNLLQ